MANILIMFPGSLKSSFVVNELKYLKTEFDKVYMLPFDEDIEVCKRIEKEYGFRVHNIVINRVKKFLSPQFWKWYFGKDVCDEKCTISNLNKIKKNGYLFFYGMYYLQSKEELDQILKNHLKDEITLYSYWLSRGAYIIAQYRKTSGYQFKKVISRAHRYDLYEYRNKLSYLPFRKMINDYLDCISFISKNGMEYYNNNYPWSKQGATKRVCYLGTENPKNLKKIIKEKDFVCVASCSSIIEVKRLDLIIDVLSQVDVPIYWIHIGDGENRREIELYAKDKFKKSNYKFLGFIENTKILETLIEYDVDYFLNLSDSEGLPVSIMEAISLGIPVIGRDVGGMSEIINVESGLLLEKKENVNTYLENVNHYLQSNKESNEYEKLSQNASDFWNKYFYAENNYYDFWKEK